MSFSMCRLLQVDIVKTKKITMVFFVCMQENASPIVCGAACVWSTVLSWVSAILYFFSPLPCCQFLYPDGWRGGVSLFSVGVFKQTVPPRLTRTWPPAASTTSRTNRKRIRWADYEMMDEYVFFIFECICFIYWLFMNFFNKRKWTRVSWEADFSSNSSE